MPLPSLQARQQLHNKEQFVKSLNETANVRMKLPQTTTDKNSFLLGLNDDVHNSIEQLNVEAQSIKVNRKKSATESTLNEEDLVKEIDKCTKSVENMKLLKANCEQSLEEMKHKRLTGDNVRTTDLLVKKLDMVRWAWFLSWYYYVDIFTVITHRLIKCWWMRSSNCNSYV